MRSRLLALTIAALGMMFVNPAAAQAATSVTLTVTGTVTSATTSDPISGVEVTLTRASSGRTVTAYTSSTGRYTLKFSSNSVRRTISLDFSDPAGVYEPAGTGWFKTTNRKTTYDQALTPVPTGTERFRVSGQVSTPDGGWLNGAAVSLVHAPADNAEPCSGSTSSGLEGRYTLTVQCAPGQALTGDFAVAASDPWGDFGSGSTNFTPVDGGEVTVNVALASAEEPPPTFTVHGAVTDEAGKPVSGAQLHLYVALDDNSEACDGSATSDARGAYVLKAYCWVANVPSEMRIRAKDDAGRYRASAQAFTPNLGGDVTLNFTLKPVGTATSSLTVLPVGSDLPSYYCVAAYDIEGEFQVGRVCHDYQSSSPEVTVPNLPAGTYAVKVSSESWANWIGSGKTAVRTYPEAEPVTLAVGQSLDLGEFTVNTRYSTGCGC